MSTRKFPNALTTKRRVLRKAQHMAKVTRIHKDKTPTRIHFIAEWIEHRGYQQSDVVDAPGVNKGTVSKWCSGDLPSEDNLLILAGFLETEPNLLFHDPNDDWLARMFRQRTADERERMKAMLEAAFPMKKDGTKN